MTETAINDHDQHYRCQICSWQHTDTRLLDPTTWCCSTCGHPVKIHLGHVPDNTFTVERHPAHTLNPGDHVLPGRDLFQLCRVLASAPIPGVPGRWQLQLEGLGSTKGQIEAEQVAADRYYNRLA